MTVVAKVKNVTKKIKETTLIDNVNLEISEGEILALVGENGAGKTSLMKLLFMFFTPTMGEIELFGQDISKSDSNKLYRKMASIIETPLFDDEMTAKQLLEIHCKYMRYQDERAIENTLQLLGLSSDKDRKIKEFSLGMKQKLAICKALVTSPSLLILDEPLNGVDTKSTNQILAMLKELSVNKKMTIIISSHVLDNLDKISDRTCILSRGKIVKEIDSKAKERYKYLEIKSKDINNVRYILRKELGENEIHTVDATKLRVYYNELDEVVIDGLMQKVMIGGASVNSISKKEISLEEYMNDRERNFI